METGLKIDNINYQKLNKKILTDINIEIPLGQLVVLLGENGVGKTTLMRIISDLNKGYTGTINLNGITDEKRKMLVSYSDSLLAFNNRDTLGHILNFYQHAYPNFKSQRAQELMTFMNLNYAQRLGELSKGNREKFVIVLTLSRKAVLYLLDEPLSGIDIFSRDKIISSLIKWIDDDTILLVSTHHVNELEQIIDSAIFLKNGKVIAQRDVESIRSDDGLSVQDYYRQVHLEN
ncbi:ATP-binding cassette domain-containing protein [Periweissella beninensis]|uniref:ABC transporter ATP-binding protein n=1 Tax=Periweissella beninensis TaxID=504936 RepID=A0ABT0VJF4_9LACO|nr:ABC transporter ATP-binding protein [Periweissella beninensis]MBM7545115.1 ABC-2 type transport system ATP-binding protein [Periweissella beninensis]MCM2437961.1 ABC transporter ATP-binding protein [Periweissella beninensis]MCT4395712.1 ABC transporter ATP-binding protein [Periweissella beninensis]